MRNFCLWALIMAVLTLRKLHARQGGRQREPVRISRWSVRATMVFSRLFAGHDALLRWAFRRLGRGLPTLTEAQRRRYLGAAR